MKIGAVVLIGLGIFLGLQGGMNPSCRGCSATYIPREEIDAYLRRAPGRVVNSVSDQQVREVDIGKSHVALGVVYRDGVQAEGSAVAEHDLVSEVYYILEGTGTLVTGPDIAGWQPRPASNENVRLLNGPGGNGASIRNGETHELKPGDVVIIPAGVGHWFTKVNGQLRYLMVRIDPDKVTPVKDEAASKADLASATHK
ncbi:MAG TPA: cupin domain-containing protein [Candidatus Acidoferrales bacterium]|jgi:mannose-6-phosphate isomerase-like protein (cupin superfamily)|nr:cupin domain-containing protein [Candidatus Acidoferrales bacterium]